MGLKQGAIGNTLGNTLETSRTYWEPIGNLMGTCWEQRKNEKKSLSPTQKLKEKKIKAL